KLDNEGINVLIGIVWFFLPLFTGAFLQDVSFSPVTKRKEQVKLRTLQLAAERAKQIQERQVFYSSPEWQLLRDRVIGEEGKRRNNCGRMISKGVDVTVDHILPRSRYPDLALRRDNLRVLCRS
ncbi:MAG TPA: HNH endonuclease, partial [Dehalococcoidia bacterium]|nr:HNH endonuclease [Dehalococcoidia bacterium]